MARNIDFIMDLPDSTQIFCGHDYLHVNIKFAMGIEKDNETYKNLLKTAEIRLFENQHLVPFSIGEEKEHNIFFRYRDQGLMDLLGVDDPIECMAKLR